jgi:hypothetical protein
MYIPARRVRVRLSEAPRLFRHVVVTLGSAVRRHLGSTDSSVITGYLLVFTCLALIIATALFVGASFQFLTPGFAIVAVLGAIALLMLRQQHETQHIPAATAAPDPFVLQELRTLRQNARWQRDILQLTHASSANELQQAATGLIMAIAGTQAQFELLGNYTLNEGSGSSITLEANGLVLGTIRYPEATLSQYQEQALRSLAEIVNLRLLALEQSDRAEQQRIALAALWEAAGLTELPGQYGLDAMRHSIERLASALGIEWVALLAPNDVSPVAPVLIADARPIPGQTLSAMHVRMAAETLRRGVPLLRPESEATVTCLPIQHYGSAPMVIVARGATSEESTQSLLLLLGSVLARRFERMAVA